MAKRKGSETELPAFVIDGEFEDTAWRAAAMKPEASRNRAEKETYKAGPAKHPFGPNAYADKMDDGRTRYFESREARDAYVNTNEAEEEGKRSRPSPAEPTGEHQAEASRVAIESAERVQRKGQDTGSGGNRGRTGR